MIIADQILKPAFVAGEIAQRFGMLQCELRRFDGVVEANQVQRTGNLPSSAQNRERIGGGSQADVPNYELPRVVLKAFEEAKLPNVQGLSFGGTTYDRMKGFAMSKGMNAMDAICEFDDSVTGGGLHGLIVLRISCQRPGQAEAGDLRAVLDAGNKCHKAGVHSLEIKEQEDSASNGGVAMSEAELWQMESAGLF